MILIYLIQNKIKLKIKHYKIKTNNINNLANYHNLANYNNHNKKVIRKLKTINAFMTNVINHMLVQEEFALTKLLNIKIMIEIMYKT